MEGGWEADALPGRRRPAREAPGKRKTSEKANVFHNLTDPGRCDLQVAPLRMEGGGKRDADETGGTGAPACPKREGHGRREEGSLQEREENRFADRNGLGGDVFYSNVSDAASRLSNGRDANSENHENRFADIESRECGGWSGTDAVVCRAGWIEWIVDSFDAIGLI